MPAVRTAIATGGGGVAAIASSFVGARSARAVYGDIMGCEAGCTVAAGGWPFAFVRDYPGMSVVGRADLSEVLFAADAFDWLPFLADWALWSAAILSALWLASRR